MSKLEDYFRSPTTEEVNEAVEEMSETYSYDYNKKQHFYKGKGKRK